MNATARKSLRERIDAAPTSKWATITAVVTAVVTFLGTSGGYKLIDRLAPRTGERLAAIEQTMKLMERDMESISRALWRAGIKVSTNGVQP